jgi:hypothetical protein
LLTDWCTTTGCSTGDWSSFDELPPDLVTRIVDFDQAKASASALKSKPDANDDLANILTAINGFAFHAQQNVADERQVREHLQQILSASDRAARLYRQYHILRLHGGIEPELIGPFPSEDARDQAARALRRENDDDVILSVDGPGASIQIEAYRHGFLSPDLQDA